MDNSDARARSGGLLPPEFRSRLADDVPVAEAPAAGRAFTARAFLLGAVMAAAVGAGVSYSTPYLQGSYMALGFGTVGAVLLLFALSALINPILKWLGPAWGLERGELLLVYIMMVMASPIPTIFVSQWLSQITVPFYYATLENEWVQWLHPHIPGWMMPRDPVTQQPFYEGMGADYAVPWRAWLPVLLVWQPFIWALFLVMIAAMVILRRQWVDNERLAYPLVQVPLALTEAGERWPPLLGNRIFWLGFAIPAVWSTLHGLYSYFPDLVPFARGVDLYYQSIPIFNGTSQLMLALRFHILGYFYFLKTEIALSLWVFNLLAKVVQSVLTQLGVVSSQNLGPGHGISNPLLLHQSMGAMLVLFLGGLWAGRRQLGEVWRKAVSGDPAIDDSREMLSYRAALLMLCGGSAVLVGWLWLAGLPVWFGLGLLFLAAVLFVGFTRLVAEGGLSDGAPPAVPAGILIAAVGSSSIGAPGLVVLATTYIWTANARSFVMASCANGLKLGGVIGGGQRSLFWAMLLALFMALAAATWMLMSLGYEHGVLNLRISASKHGPYNYVQGLIRHPSELQLWGWVNTGIGALIMLGLTLARWYWARWPLHPLGYPVGPTWIMDHLWFNMFLAWLIKVLVLKYGGAELYQKSRPFFIGMILGQLTPGGIFLVVDHFSGTVGNVIFWG